jgi:DNA-binding SARP family transcriptional activator
MTSIARDRAPYTLTLFASIELRPTPEAARLLVQSKVVALLAYLTVPDVGRFARRDTLVGLLWPELDQARARKALRQAILAIRSALGATALDGRGDEEIAMSPNRVWCDVAAFTHAADSGLLMQALQLYKGDMMPGFHLDGCQEFDQWLEAERVAARERAAATAWALAQRFETDKQLSDATGMARQSVRLAWTNERAVRRALAMLDRLGDAAGAARLYQDFTARLRAELDMAPSPETTELMERIRQHSA